MSDTSFTINSEFESSCGKEAFQPPCKISSTEDAIIIGAAARPQGIPDPSRVDQLVNCTTSATFPSRTTDLTHRYLQTETLCQCMLVFSAMPVERTRSSIGLNWFVLAISSSMSDKTELSLNFRRAQKSHARKYGNPLADWLSTPNEIAVVSYWRQDEESQYGSSR
jgi:hypothetical protein